jgi:uncharacterized protein (TIGR04255 family)
VQFAADVVDLAVLASFGGVVRPELPRWEQHPKAAPMREVFDAPQPQHGFQIMVEPPQELPRTWFISEDNSRLVQLQGDRISFNWRRQTESARYPRYRVLRKDFRRYFETLRQCIEVAGKGMPVINACEVTYVNPIEVPAKGRGGGHPELAHVINRIRPRPRGAFLPHAEDAQFQTRWRISGDEIGVTGRPAGRLYLAAQPGLTPPPGQPGVKPAASTPIYMVTLTGRLLPAAGDEREAWKALDVAHKWVVLGFKDVTSEKMHDQWGFKEGE